MSASVLIVAAYGKEAEIAEAFEVYKRLTQDIVSLAEEIERLSSTLDTMKINHGIMRLRQREAFTTLKSVLGDTYGNPNV